MREKCTEQNKNCFYDGQRWRAFSLLWSAWQCEGGHQSADDGQRWERKGLKAIWNNRKRERERHIGLAVRGQRGRVKKTEEVGKEGSGKKREWLTMENAETSCHICAHTRINTLDGSCENVLSDVGWECKISLKRRILSFLIRLVKSLKTKPSTGSSVLSRFHLSPAVSSVWLSRGNTTNIWLFEIFLLQNHSRAKSGTQPQRELSICTLQLHQSPCTVMKYICCTAANTTWAYTVHYILRISTGLP